MDVSLARLRWILLPVMAAGAFFLFFEPTARLAHHAVSNGFEGASGLMWVAGQWLVPAMVGLLLCYPLARVFGRRAGLAGLAVAALASAYYAWRIDGASLVGPILLCLSVPVLAVLAQRALADSPQLEWVAGDVDRTGARAPGKLAWTLVPLLAAAFFILHDLVQAPLIEVAFAPTSATLDRIGMLAISVAKPALAAWPVAYVIACVHGRRAAWIGALVALPTAVNWTMLFLLQASLPWVKAAYAVELLCLLAFVPWFASRMGRGPGAGRLVLGVPGGRGEAPGGVGPHKPELHRY